MGIGMVFQHFSLFEAMTVLENIALGLDERLEPAELEKRIREVLARYGLDPRPAPHRLDALGRRAPAHRDRPGAAAEPEAPDHGRADQRADAAGGRRSSSRRCAAWPANGCSILYISHKLHEIKALCDAATILRGGKVVGECVPAEETSRSMAEMMIGGSLKDIRKAAGRGTGRARSSWSTGLSLPGTGDFDVALKDIRFACRRRDLRHRRGRRQRPERAAAGAVRRDAGGAAPRRSGSTASRSARSDRRPPPPRALRGSGGAQRPRRGAGLLARRQRGADRPRTARAWCGNGVIIAAAARGFAARGDPRLRGQGDRAGGDSRVALGRQPAEVHHGPRGAADARRC